MRHNPDAMALLKSQAVNGADRPKLLCDLAAVTTPKAHVMILPAERIREVDGRTEVLIPRKTVVKGELVEGEGWGPVPEGRKVVAEGAHLKDADLDIAYVIRSVLVGGGIVTAGGKQPASAVPVVELGRSDLLETLAAHRARRGA